MGDIAKKIEDIEAEMARYVTLPTVPNTFFLSYTTAQYR